MVAWMILHSAFRRSLNVDAGFVHVSANERCRSSVRDAESRSEFLRRA